MSSEHQPLDVVIVGAGLAGLLAARVLREKHSVTIYERTSTAQEAGAAINIGPNGVRILDTLHFDRLKAGSISVGATQVYNKDGKLTLDKTPDYAAQYGADWLFHHRSDLRAEFLRLATTSDADSGIAGRPAKIHWNTPVAEVDVEEGRVVLASGEEVFADLVIAADGIKSVIRPLVVGDAAYTSARPSGLSAFRFTLNAPLITEQLGRTPEILNANKPACLSMVYSFDGTMRSVVMYPCRGFKLLNFVAIIPDKSLKQASTESWSASGDRNELLSIFQDFPTWVLDYLRMATDLKLWQLRDQDPLPTYIKGRAVLIGDAAHAMTPHQGQGGTQAVEDAEGFRIFLQPDVSSSSVHDLLKDFDRVRRPRASQIQDNTRKAHDKRTAEEVYMFEKINWTYPGVIESLQKLPEDV
ncbi:hypothetical protein BKA63DRAFT_401100 [Paraphoma chrysanthemicola]|nr:hypothetical protein BKA63DRAFT_401100 [Paraphoma chrysanthemicola]